MNKPALTDHAEIQPQADVRPFADFQANSDALIQRLRDTQRALILTQSHDRAVVVLDLAEYRQLLDQIDVLREIHLGLRQIADGEGIPQDEMERRILSALPE